MLPLIQLLPLIQESGRLAVLWVPAPQDVRRDICARDGTTDSRSPGCVLQVDPGPGLPSAFLQPGNLVDLKVSQAAMSTLHSQQPSPLTPAALLTPLWPWLAWHSVIWTRLWHTQQAWPPPSSCVPRTPT